MSLNLQPRDPEDGGWASSNAASWNHPIPADFSGEDSIRAPKHKDRARIESKAWEPVPITELPPSTPPDWIWRGFIARGYVTLFVGLWKTGKTTFINHLIRDATLGGGLISEPLDGPALIVSEEPDHLWSARRDELDLGSSVHLILRPFGATPGTPEWEEFAWHIAERVESNGYSLVVFDTLPDLWPVYDENNAPEVQRSLKPLHQITSAGAALLLVHHARKGGGTEAQSVRGSGALPGWVDMIIEFGRRHPDNPTDCSRLLRTYGRLPDIQPETVVELQDGVYRVTGDRAHATREDVQRRVEEVLREASGQDLDTAAIVAKCAGLSKRNVEVALKDGAQSGRWERLGGGKKGDPYTYRAKCDSRQPHSLGARIESDGCKPDTSTEKFSGEPDWSVTLPPSKQHADSQHRALEASPMPSLESDGAQDRPEPAGEA